MLVIKIFIKYGELELYSCRYACFCAVPCCAVSGALGMMAQPVLSVVRL
jgi:hypothetical protein